MSSLDERISKAAEDVQQVQHAHWRTANQSCSMFLAWNPILRDRDRYYCHCSLVY